MSLRKQAVSVVLPLMLFASMGSATAQERVVIEIYVNDDGSVDIVCPTAACNAICRDIEGTQLLVADTYYRIGSNCSLTITDGAQLNEAMEELIAFLGDEIPGGPMDTGATNPPGLENAESNPNQNTVPPSSANAPPGLGGTPPGGGG